MGKFEELYDGKDPRTIEEMIEDDRAAGNSEVVTITEVERITARDGKFFQGVSWGSWGTSFKLTDPDNVSIKVGDQIEIFSPGIGYERYGWALNGEIIEYLTPWERFAKRVQWLAQHDREKRERFVEMKAKLDADYEALSPPLKVRIDRFRSEDPFFRIDSEFYEMFCCVDADKIANFLRPRVEAGEDAGDVVQEFYKLGHEEQNRLIPELLEGHSGNTFGGACSLAAAILQGKEV